MKKILLPPLMIVTGCLMSSCGSSPDAPEIKPVINETFVDPYESNEESVSLEQTAIPVNSAIPIATKVAGRPGFVFNPFNQNMVDVENLSSGMKVRDPQDPDPSHIFVVP